MAIVEHEVVMHLPKPYYRAIGEFIFRYSQLEYQLHEIVWMSLDLSHKQGRILTIGTDITVICRQLKVITSKDTWVKKKKRKDEIDYLSKQASDLNEFRNQIAHGSWQSLDGTSKNVCVHIMKPSQHRYLPKADFSKTDKTIRVKCVELKVLNLRAKKLIKQLFRERPSARKKSS
jgi:hypothetical protein